MPHPHRLLRTIQLLLLAASTLSAQDPSPTPYLDERLAPWDRATDLLSRLTTEEKISLLQYKQPAIARLGMHAYSWWNEALHGVARNGLATVFPQAIGMAATWDTALIRRQGDAVAAEARVKYDRALLEKGATDTYQGLTFWSPNINIFRDPRWGRGQETFGEDPFLTASIGAAYVRGLQGDDPVYLKTAATAKHFAVHSGPEHSRHSFDAAAPPRDLRETYLPAFEHLVKSARVEAVMCAYNSIDEQPCCANDSLLNGILRREWGFRGHVVSDCWAISDMVDGHKTHSSEKDAAVASLAAGCDLSCGPEMSAITVALQEGLVTMAAIDNAVHRLLVSRVRLGMFSDRSVRPWFNTNDRELNSPEHDSLALLVASGSMVLLRNEDGILPLPSGIGRIGIVGPIASDTLVLLGNYNGTPADPETFLRGITDHIAPGSEIVYTAGYAIPWDSAWKDGTSASLTTFAYTDLFGIDTVIVFAGISAALEGEDGDTRNRIGGFHRGDRTTLDLPSDQKRLIRALRDAGKKIILVVTSGGPISLTEEVDLVDAIVQAWYPGQRGGTALARLLFGLESPSGRLPVTVYRSVADLPEFENYSMEGRTYRYFRGEPLFAFGHGLSYASFRYEDLRVGPESVDPGDTVRLTVRVTNTSDLDGVEVVQAYVNKPADDRTNRSLCAYAMVFIPAGGSIDVEMAISPEQLRSFDQRAGVLVIRPGEYRLGVGRSSGDILIESHLSVH